MLDKLKTTKNPHYQFYDDYNSYKGRCKPTDPAGYDALFLDEINEELDLVDTTILQELVDELEIEPNDNLEEENQDEKDEIEKIPICIQ